MNPKKWLFLALILTLCLGVNVISLADPEIFLTNVTESKSFVASDYWATTTACNDDTPQQILMDTNTAGFPKNGYINIDFNSLGEGWEIVNATLSLYSQSQSNYNSAYTYQQYYCNNFLTSCELTTTNESLYLTDCSETPFINTTLWNYGNSVWVDFNVTDIVSFENSEDKTFLFYLKMLDSDETTRGIYWKSQSAPGLEPYLTIAYTEVTTTTTTTTTSTTTLYTPGDPYDWADWPGGFWVYGCLALLMFAVFVRA